jgi:hypothetical protein
MKFATQAALAALLLAGASEAQAQFPVRPQPPGSLPQTQPVFSPYLNLLRRDNPGAVNYYGLVRPEIEFRNSLQGLQQQVTLNRLALNQQIDPTTGLPATGHSAYFLNLGGYFMNLSGAGGGASQAFGATSMRGAGGQAGAPTLSQPASGAFVPRR